MSSVSSRPTFSRRDFLKSAVRSAACTIGSLSFLTAAGASASDNALARQPGLAAGDSNLDPFATIVRLRGCRSGEFWLWIAGDVFGRTPSESLRPLSGFCSVLRMRYREIEGKKAYAFEQRESCHFYDVGDASVLEEWVNPYTGKTNIAVGYVAPEFRFRLDADGVHDAGNALTLQSGGFPRGVETDGTDVWSTEVRRNEYATGLRGNDIPEAHGGSVRRSTDIVTYRAPIDQVLDDSVRVVQASATFMADLPWLQWMLMGSRPGNVFWYGHGKKCVSADEIPDAIAERVERIHPGFLADPWGLDGTPYGTLYQMRELRKEGKI